MAGALTILLFVASGEASDPTTRAVVRATREALGVGSKVEIRETAGELAEDEAVIAEQLAGADAVVDLMWTDPAHRSVSLRVHVARSGRWIGRSIGFMASDASTERGRTIGFTLVSMLPEPAVEPAPPADTQPIPTTNSEPPAAPPPVRRAEQTLRVQETNVAPLPSASPAHSSFALDLFALGAWGVDGEGASGGGGALAFHWFPTEILSARLGGSLRAGSIAAVPASTLTAALSAGIVWHPLHATPLHPFGVSLRVEYAVLYQSLHQPPGDLVTQDGRTLTSGDRWLSGMGTAVDLSWLFFTDVEAVAGMGLEEAFGSTYVQVPPSNAAIASFPMLRVIGEAGLRVRF